MLEEAVKKGIKADLSTVFTEPRIYTTFAMGTGTAYRPVSNLEQLSKVLNAKLLEYVGGARGGGGGGYVRPPGVTFDRRPQLASATHKVLTPRPEDVGIPSPSRRCGRPPLFSKPRPRPNPTRPNPSRPNPILGTTSRTL